MKHILKMFSMAVDTLQKREVKVDKKLGDFDSRSKNGRTSLSYAAKEGGADVVRLIFESGKVEITFKDSEAGHRFSGP
jgi:ankyrin repeat protein